MLLRPAPPGSRRRCLRWSRWTCGCCASAQGRAVDDCRRGPAVASARSEPRQHHPHPPTPPSAPPGSLTGHHFMNLNTISVKVFVLLHSSQVMETSQSAVAKHDGTEEDGVKRLREILFFLYYPWRTLSVHDASCCPISYSETWDFLHRRCGVPFRLYLQSVCVCSYKAGEWKWARRYRRGRSPDHSLSDRCLISADSIRREVRGSLHHTHAVPTLIRY